MAYFWKHFTEATSLLTYKTYSRGSLLKGLYPVYDKDENDNEILVLISPSEDKDDLAETSEKDEQNFTGEIAPSLPPKKGSKVTKESEQLPPLPPRSLPATSVRSHRASTGWKEPAVRGEGKVQEPLQDTGLYEPISFHASDEESDVDEPQSESQSIKGIYMYNTVGCVFR